MAFCAECGKSNVEQATTCDGCGKPMRTASKGGGPARFKGTMIMAGAAPKPAAAPAQPVTPAPAPASAPQPNLAFQATMMGPVTAPGSSAPPPAAQVVPVAVPAAPASPRVSAKGTMIGGMNAFQIPGPAGSARTGTPAPTNAVHAMAAQAASASVTAPSHQPSGSAPQVVPAYDGASTGSAFVEQPVAPSLDINYGESGGYGGYGVGPKKSNTMLWIGVGIIGAIGFVVAAVGVAVWLGVISF